MKTRCGEPTSKGTPCRRLALFENGRCMWHGGEGKTPDELRIERQEAKRQRVAARIRVLVRRFKGAA